MIPQVFRLALAAPQGKGASVKTVHLVSHKITQTCAMKTLLTLPTLIAVVVTGLTTASFAGDPPRQKLQFLVNGRTTRGMVFEAFGPPTSTYERGRIQTYRLAGKEQDGFIVRDRPSEHRLRAPHLSWGGTSHSLVLIFDTAGTLRRHSLVKVN